MSMCDDASWVYPPKPGTAVLGLPCLPSFLLLGPLAAPVPHRWQAGRATHPCSLPPDPPTVSDAADKAMSGRLWNFIPKGSASGSRAMRMSCPVHRIQGQQKSPIKPLQHLGCSYPTCKGLNQAGAVRTLTSTGGSWEQHAPYTRPPAKSNFMPPVFEVRRVILRTAKVQILERASQMATACTTSERQSHPLQ